MRVHSWPSLLACHTVIPMRALPLRYGIAGKAGARRAALDARTIAALLARHKGNITAAAANTVYALSTFRRAMTRVGLNVATPDVSSNPKP